MWPYDKFISVAYCISNIKKFKQHSILIFSIDVDIKDDYHNDVCTIMVNKQSLIATSHSRIYFWYKGKLVADRWSFSVDQCEISFCPRVTEGEARGT